MTASHCVSQFNGNPRGFTVTLGEHNKLYSEGTEQKINVKRIIMHSQYSLRAMEFDIALLELERPATLNDRVTLGCVPRKGAYPRTGSQCYIAGKLSMHDI